MKLMQLDVKEVQVLEADMMNTLPTDWADRKEIRFPDGNGENHVFYHRKAYVL